MSLPPNGPSTNLRLLLTAAAVHVRAYLRRHVAAEYVYHDLVHTEQVVRHARTLGPLEGLSTEDQLLLELAAWFHDTGYDRGPDGHELRSCINAKAFLRPRGLPDAQLDCICEAIEATRLPHRPRTVLGQLLCDADLGHLGTKDYWERCRRVRQELLMARGVVLSDAQWVAYEIDFLVKHRYFSAAALARYGKRKRKHLKQLRKQQREGAPPRMSGVDALAKRDKKQKKRHREVDDAMRSADAPAAPGHAGPPEVPEHAPAPPPRSEDAAPPPRGPTDRATPLLRHAVARIDRQANALLLGGAGATVLVVVGLVSAGRGLLFPGALLLLTCLLAVAAATTAVRLPAPAGEEARALRRKQDYLSTAYAIVLCGTVATAFVFGVRLLV